jgi:hypothetical protein
MTALPSPGKPVLHADFISLAANTTADARRDLIAAARDLASLTNVLAVHLIDGDASADFDLALLFLLPDLAALEPFGTEGDYVRFLQGKVAPLLQTLAGADVQLDGDFQPGGERATCLALAASAETYDWEVSSFLADWLEQLAPRSAVKGLAAGERQRYRGLALAFTDATPAAVRPVDPRFTCNLVSGRLSWLSA